MAKYDLAWQERVGPAWDAVCGNAGEDTDLNALVAAGKSRIILGEGAILTANLTITAISTCLWSPRMSRSINLGAYTITVNNAYCHLEGFKISGAVGSGIVVSTNANGFSVHRVNLNACGAHGIHLNNTYNDHEIVNCLLNSNTVDGVLVGASSGAARIEGNMIYGNGGYGVNDGSNDAIIVGNRLDNNSLGAINGTPAIDVGNKKT